MPFNGSGDFSRVHNWQQDRDNGIKILALRMDQEFDNFQGGMNLVFLRNGLVPMTGNLNMGTNYLLGLGAGSVGSLPVRFSDDPNTGLFLNGFNKLGLVSNGVLRLEANTAGVAVTGTLNSTGALTQNGSQVWHAGNFNPALYGLLAGNQNWTGNNAFLATPLIDGGAGAAYLNFANAAGNYLVGASAGTNEWKVRENQFGVDRLVINSLGNVSIGGALNVVGAITQAGNQVWHAGNFNPASYAALTGASFTGDVLVTSPGVGGLWVQKGDATHTGYVSFYNQAGTREAFIGFATIGGPTLLSGGTGGWSIIGGPVGLGGNTAVTGTLSATGAITQAGNQVWHAGNFTPGNYAALSGATFSGNVSAPRFGVDANAYFQIPVSDPLLVMDTNDYYGYSRSGNQHVFAIANTNYLTIGTGGITVNGNITKSGAGIALTRGAGGLSATVTQGTAAPSGGSDGDIYLQYT